MISPQRGLKKLLNDKYEKEGESKSFKIWVRPFMVDIKQKIGAMEMESANVDNVNAKMVLLGKIVPVTKMIVLERLKIINSVVVMAYVILVLMT